MCFNEYVSFSVFGVGTILNILMYKMFNDSNILVIAIMWQWILWMQLFEGFMWLSMKHNKKSLNEIGVYGAYITNVLQPIVLFVSLILLTKQHKYYKIVGGIISLMYISIIIYKYVSVTKNKLQLDLYKKTEYDCHHIDYTWWNDNMIGYIYCVFIILLLVFAIPHKIYIFQLVCLILTWIIAMNTFSKCGNYSMWCFIVLIIPILTIIYHKIYGL